MGPEILKRSFQTRIVNYESIYLSAMDIFQCLRRNGLFQ